MNGVPRAVEHPAIATRTVNHGLFVRGLRLLARQPSFSGPFLPINLATMLLVLCGSVIPLIYVVYLSLIDSRPGALSGQYTGFENYEFAFGDSTMTNAMWNTLYFSTASVALASLLGIAIAALMDSAPRARGFLMMAVVLPWALPEVVTALMWQWLFNAKWGLINALLLATGAIDRYVSFFSDGAAAMHVLIFAYSWKLVPFVVIIVFAAFRSVPDELYETAQIDGAGSIRIFFSITLPLVRSAIVVAVLFCVIWSMRAFDLIYVLTRGGPGESTFVLAYYTYWKAFQYADFGAGAAVSVILALLTLSVTVLYWRQLESGADE